MQLVLHTTEGAPTQSSKQKHKSHLSLLAMLNNKATQDKLESVNYLATQTK